MLTGVQGQEEEQDDEGIEAEPDVGGSREAEEEVITLEQCLAWGGEQRQRCRLTLAVSGEPYECRMVTLPLKDYAWHYVFTTQSCVDSRHWFGLQHQFMFEKVDKADCQQLLVTFLA